MVRPQSARDILQAWDPAAAECEFTRSGEDRPEGWFRKKWQSGELRPDVAFTGHTDITKVDRQILVPGSYRGAGEPS